MQLSHIRLTNYRNHTDTRLELHPKLNLWVGRNGAGKTNLLDAVYLLSLGKSYFQYKDGQNVRFGADFYRIEGMVRYKEEQHRVVVKFHKGQKDIEVDDVTMGSLAEYVGRFPCTIIAPGDIDIVYGGSEVRRRLLDQTIGQADKQYLSALMHYNRALKQRNALLKQYHTRLRQDDPVLFKLNETLARTGEVIFGKRRSFLEVFQALFADTYKWISDGAETISLAYESDLSDTPSMKGLEDSFRQDLQLQRTTFGVHRDNILLHLEDHPLNRAGSQGQIKTTVLALKFAQYGFICEQSGVAPFLLLDDIFDKLDPYRISRLLTRAYEGAFGQVFVTDAFSSRLPELLGELGIDNYAIHEIRDGSVMTPCLIK